MTKRRERGENELTRLAKLRAARTKQHVCVVLASMLAKAKAEGNPDLVRRVIRAQKYLGCRNVPKRRE